jgi:hypothetical protein
MGTLLHALHERQPLPIGPYPTAQFPAHLPEPARFTGPAHYSTEGDAAYAASIVRDTAPNGEDLSNELDAEVCGVLLNLLDSGLDEPAGLALRIIRDAMHRRYIARAWGDKPAASDDTMAALKSGMGGLV